MRKIYQLRVSLDGTAPPVWRRILVSANVTLRQAHGVLQKAMGWDGTLEYVYRQDGREFGPPANPAVYVEDDSMFSLRYCLCLKGHTLEYAYGPWRHTILLEEVDYASGRFPWRLEEGEGECPVGPTRARIARVDPAEERH